MPEKNGSNKHAFMEDKTGLICFINECIGCLGKKQPDNFLVVTIYFLAAAIKN
jgi:hypothetical protein